MRTQFRMRHILKSLMGLLVKRVSEVFWDENREHLYFPCPFASRGWDQILRTFAILFSGVVLGVVFVDVDRCRLEGSKFFVMCGSGEPLV